MAGSEFLRRVAETCATQVAMVGLGLVTTVLVARSLGPEGRGMYAAAMSFALLGTQFGHLGLHLTNNYYLARKPADLTVIMGNALAVSLGLGGAGAAVAAIVFQISPRLPPVRGGLLFLALALIPISLCYMLLVNLLPGLHQVRVYNRMELINRALAVSCIGCLLLSRRASPETMLATSLAAYLATIVLIYHFLAGRVPGLPRPSAQVLKEHLRTSAKPYLIALFTFVGLRVDVLMMQYIRGAELTGYYSIAAGMAEYMLMLPNVIAVILFPRLSALADTREKLRNARRVAAGTAAIMVAAVGTAALCANTAVKLLFGNSFLPAAAALMWLLPGVLALAIETVLAQFLNSTGFPANMVVMWLSLVLVKVSLNLWAIPRFGINGAAAVSSLTYILALVTVVGIIRFGWYPDSSSHRCNPARSRFRPPVRCGGVSDISQVKDRKRN